MLTHLSISLLEKKKKIEEWTVKPFRERLSKRDLMRSLHMSPETFNPLVEQVRLEVRKRGVETAMRGLARNKAKDRPPDSERYADKEALDEIRLRKLEDHLWEEATKPNAPANKMELYLKLKGKLIEKREDRITIVNADEIARRNLQADRELIEGGYRVEEVQEEPSLLSE